MTDCEACANPRGIYIMGCQGCAARLLASGPHYADSKRAGKLTTAYVLALKTAGLTHEQVKKADEVKK